MRGGERMDRKAANRVVKRLVKEAGITKRISCHSLRHTFVTMAHEAGVPPRTIQHSMGYSDLRMISYYDRGMQQLSAQASHAVAAFLDVQ